MQVTLNQKDIFEAVTEWLNNRGVVSKDMEIHAAQRNGKWMFSITVENVELPVKEGPYR